MNYPTNLPNVANAKLPATYEAAKASLTECTRVDECADWANKAEAMAAYARMSEDETLRKMCDRIQARALRRCGELLKIHNAQGRRTDQPLDGSGHKSQQEVGAEAGLSERQQKTAVRISNVSEADFERQVESDSPPTVTALAEQGKKTRVIDLTEGRDHEEYAMATQAQGRLHEFAAFASKTDPAAVARGSSPTETKEMRKQIAIVDGWLDVLITRLES